MNNFEITYINIGLPAVASVGRPRVLNGVLGAFVPSECTFILILISVQSFHPLLWAWIPFFVIILYFLYQKIVIFNIREGLVINPLRGHSLNTIRNLHPGFGDRALTFRNPILTNFTLYGFGERFAINPHWIHIRETLEVT